MPESRSTCEVEPSGIAIGRSTSCTATTWRAPPRTNMIPLLGCASWTPPTSTPSPAMRSSSPRPNASSESTVESPTRSPWRASDSAALTAPPLRRKRSEGSGTRAPSGATLTSASPAQITSNARPRESERMTRDALGIPEV
jgi:hypothetical protein